MRQGVGDVESKKSGNVVFASVLAVASLQVPGRESHGQCGSGKHDYDDDERERSGTKDSDSYRFAKNSTVLSIPTSQGVFGTRSEIRSSRLCDPSPSYRSGTPRRRTREPERDASRSAVCLSVRVIRERETTRERHGLRVRKRSHIHRNGDRRCVTMVGDFDGTGGRRRPIARSQSAPRSSPTCTHEQLPG